MQRQAILEGVATTYPQTETVIENGIVSGMKASDVQKILNLKHAWEFILDKDVLSYGTNYDILCHIAKLVNEGFYTDGGRIRGVPVTIGGTGYVTQSLRGLHPPGDATPLPPIPKATILQLRLLRSLPSESAHPVTASKNLQFLIATTGQICYHGGTNSSQSLNFLNSTQTEIRVVPSLLFTQ